MRSINLGPLTIAASIPMTATINRSPWVMKQLSSEGYDPLKTITLIPSQDLLTFHVRYHLYKSVESEFVFPDAHQDLVQLMPDLNQLFAMPAYSTIEMNVDTDFYLAMIVNDIQAKFGDIADRFYNREVLYNPSIHDLHNADHEMEWICKMIDTIDLESMIRASILDPSTADVLIVSYNKYRDFFADDTINPDEDVFT